MSNDERRSPARATRRQMLIGAATVAIAAGMTETVKAANAKTGSAQPMKTVVVKDGTNIYYKDWGRGPPLVFSHGWPLTADAWDNQMLFFANRGYRVIAHDRRGHGRSDQPSRGNDMDTYADDLAALLEALDLKGAVMIGHSTGGGEVARYIGRYGVARVAKAVLVSSVAPHMLKTAENPVGAPMSVFDGLRNGVASDRPGFYRNLAMPFFGYNRPEAKVLQGAVDSFCAQGMLGGIKGQYECIKAFSETDFTGDLKRMTVPTLVMHGDDDQIVPIEISSLKTAKMAPKATLKVYTKAPHGLCVTLADQVNGDLLDFIKAS